MMQPSLIACLAMCYAYRAMLSSPAPREEEVEYCEAGEYSVPEQRSLYIARPVRFIWRERGKSLSSPGLPC
jgi:hypothetical protein